MKKREIGKKPFSLLCSVVLVASLCLPTAALADVGAGEAGQGANAGQVAGGDQGAGNGATNDADSATVDKQAGQADAASVADVAEQSTDQDPAVQAAGVAAIGDTQYATLQDAIDAAKDGDTVKLLTDVVEDITVASGKSLTLNLAGCILTNKSSHTIVVSNGASLTVLGEGTVDNVTHQKADIYNNGTLHLEGGTYTRSKEASSSTGSSGGNSYYNILNHGAATIDSAVKVISTGPFPAWWPMAITTIRAKTNFRGMLRVLAKRSRAL